MSGLKVLVASLNNYLLLLLYYIIFFLFHFQKLYKTNIYIYIHTLTHKHAHLHAYAYQSFQHDSHEISREILPNMSLLLKNVGKLEEKGYCPLNTLK